MGALTKRLLLCITVVCLLSGIGDYAIAQEFPVRAITMVCGSPPGGITDSGTRIIASEAKKILGVEILCTNKPGAMHTVVMSYVLTQPADGYLLGTSSDAPFARAPHVLKLNFNPMADISPIIVLGYYPHVIIARGDSPFKTFKDAIDFARKNPGKLTSGDLGLAGTANLNMTGLSHQMGLKVSMVPFQGDAELLAAVLGGHVMVAGLASNTCESQIKAGKIKILAVTENQRWDKYPDVPSLYELGYKDACPQPTVMVWGRKGIPEPILKKIEDTFTKATETKAYKDWAVMNEMYPITRLGYKGSTGQELQKFLTDSYQIYGTLIKTFGGEQPASK